MSSPVEIKTEIPKESSGRALDALTDLIRPLSESFGLIGDKIALHRQKVLHEIAKRTRKRLETLNKDVKPIPPKFLVPLLEKASLEDVNDEKLMDMWSNLLVTSATENVELLGQYSTILAEITSDQVRLMERILRLNEGEIQDAGIFIDNFYYLNQSGLPGSIDRFSHLDSIEAFADSLANEFDINGVALDCVNIFFQDESRGAGMSFTSPDGVYSDDQFYDFENLTRLGLLAKCEVKRHKVGLFDVDAHYYVVTPVGIDLYACCNPSRLAREVRLPSP
jgi:hypothetical protein